MKRFKQHLTFHKAIIGISALIVLTLLIGIPLYLYRQKEQQITTKMANPKNDLSDSEVQSLIKRVGKHVELPQKEKPTLATVSNVEKLQSQSFFQQAKNGDKVLIYMQSRKAYLYRPSIDKVLDIAPVNLPTPTAKPEVASATVKQGIPIVIYNGSGSNARLQQIQSVLEGEEGIVIEEAATAEKTYRETIVVDIAGEQATLASALALKVRGRVGKLPVGEEEPDTDGILIVIGTTDTKTSR